ncbi:SLAP domain-containing protein [Clostridium botulinum]|nr:SLAP domain-containing protein [Clostridium botulinum]
MNFDELALTLVNSKNEEVATEIFLLREVGTIPGKSARPWKLYFDKEKMAKVPDTLEDCKVIFNKDIKAISTVEVEFENIPSNMNMDLQRNLQKYLKSLPIIKKGDVTFNTYEVKLKMTVQLL